MSLVETVKRAKDVKEPQSQPDGQYKLSIISVKDGEGKESGKPYTRFTYKVENPQNSPAQLVSEIVMHVDSEADDDTNDRRALQIRRIKEAFKLVDADFNDYEKLKGKMAWADLKETDDSEYGLQNSVRKWIQPTE